MTPFNLKIITPDKVFYDGETSNVIVRTTVGDVGILARHEPYVAALPIGIMRVMSGNDVQSGKYKTAAITNGTIKVAEGGDTVILVQSCEWGDEIDLARAEAARERAERQLSDDSIDGVKLELAEIKLKRALNRINAVQNK